MKYIKLSNGIEIPMIGFGTARLEGDVCIDSVLNAIKLGYRHIDTAQMYHNEKEVGIAVKKSGVDRKELFITTKIYSISRSYHKTKLAIDESLSNLGLDYIDLILIHEPYSEAIEMYKALEEAYIEGKVKAIGISNYNTNLYLDFIKNVKIIPMVNQVECHVYYQNHELEKVLTSHQTVMESWSSLTALKKDIINDKVLVEIGRKYNKTAAQIALKYLLERNIIIIPKSSNTNRMKENLDLFDFNLDSEDISIINKLDKDKTLFGWY